MKYRKKPLVVEAFRFEVDDNLPWFDAAFREGSIRFKPGKEDWPEAHIKTLEGTMVAEVGDYIIQGIKGEPYPCKPDIFEATYEGVTDG